MLSIYPENRREIKDMERYNPHRCHEKIIEGKEKEMASLKEALDQSRSEVQGLSKKLTEYQEQLPLELSSLVYVITYDQNIEECEVNSIEVSRTQSGTKSIINLVSIQDNQMICISSCNRKKMIFASREAAEQSLNQEKRCKECKGAAVDDLKEIICSNPESDEFHNYVDDNFVCGSWGMKYE